ncbi:MAG: hypothetical protein AAGK05_18285, partial [Pseudomonadota bacterium]
MSYKILVPIDLCNKVIQARDATLDIEEQNSEELLQGLIELRSNLKPIWHEAKLVSNLGIEVALSQGLGGKKRKITQQLQDEFYDVMPDTDFCWSDCSFQCCQKNLTEFLPLEIPDNVTEGIGTTVSV